MDKYVTLLKLLFILFFVDINSIYAQQRSIEQVEAIALSNKLKAKRNAPHHSRLKSTEILDKLGIDSSKEASLQI